MTDKQERILRAALELFANEGYNASSTSKIAKKAGVSEGLIFRHFGNKKGLLTALMQQAEEILAALFGQLVFETDPKEVIRKVIDMPFGFAEKDHDFWRLQFILKWQKEYQNPDKMKPLQHKVEWAFTTLGYAEPVSEAKVLELMLEAISTAILKGDRVEEVLPLQAFLKQKYQV